MSVSSEISRIKANISNAYTACGNKGATLPQTQNSANLAATINAISAGAEVITETYSQVNAVAANFLTNVSYSPTDYTTSLITDYSADTSVTYKDRPAGLSLGQSKTFLLIDKSNGDHCVEGNGNTIYNIAPTALGGLAIIGNLESTIKLQPTGELRMIMLSSCRNVRDLGGWSCDGGTVKYGALFRGAKFAGSQSVTINDADKTTLKSLIGVRAEIDFQSSSEGGARDYSALGREIVYTATPTAGYYDAMVNLAPGNTSNSSQVKAALLAAMDNVIDGLPTYFHCFYGADRTGTFACILLALLGVAQSDIDKDYELTTFSGQERMRNGGVQTSGGIRKYCNLIAYFNGSANVAGADSGFSGFGKSNLRDNVLQWALQLGIPLAKINAFRTAMISGNPQPLVADTVTVTNNLTNASTSNTSQSTNKYDSYTATITANSGYSLIGADVSVTMGGVDITSTAYSSGVISIPTVTGAIVISIVAAAPQPARLPADYQEVEYIENATTAWIDTGIVSKYGICTNVGASITTYGSYQSVIGAYSGTVRDTVGWNGSKSWWQAPNSTNAGTEVEGLSRNTKYDIECRRTSDGYLNYGSTSAGTNAFADFTNTVNYSLFTRNRGTTQEHPFLGKIYYCEIYDGSTLVANMIPCYHKSDNVVGMYDLVRNTFYTSANSDVFGKGADV